MGYDLHITRRNDWSDVGNDISKEEFVAYVRGDPEFTFPSALGDDYADWKSPRSGIELWLCWDRGSLQTKNPEPEFIDKVVAIAKILEARVQGDDGEIYHSSTDIR